MERSPLRPFFLHGSSILRTFLYYLNSWKPSRLFTLADFSRHISISCTFLRPLYKRMEQATVFQRSQATSTRKTTNELFRNTLIFSICFYLPPYQWCCYLYGYHSLPLIQLLDSWLCSLRRMVYNLAALPRPDTCLENTEYSGTFLDYGMFPRGTQLLKK